MFKFGPAETATPPMSSTVGAKVDSQVVSSSPTIKSTKSPSFNEKITQMPATKSTPNIKSNEATAAAAKALTVTSSSLKLTSPPRVPLIENVIDDDLASVTSSEFDKSSSIGGMSLSLFRARSSAEVTPNASLSSKTLNNAYKDEFSPVTIASSSSFNEKKPLYKKNEKSKSPVTFHHSSSTTQNDNENSDTDMVDMDHIFAKEKARQGIKLSKKEATPPLTNNSVSTQALDKAEKNSMDINCMSSRNGGITNRFASEQNVNRSRATSSPAHHHPTHMNGVSFDKDESDIDERNYLRNEKEKNDTKIRQEYNGGSEANFAHKEKGSKPFFSSIRKRAKSRASLSSLFRAVNTFIYLCFINTESIKFHVSIYLPVILMTKLCLQPDQGEKITDIRKMFSVFFIVL